jgi:hypothetical protein
MEDEMKPKEHNGHTITLTEDWRFAISGPLVDDSMHRRVYSVFSEAEAAIDDRVKQNERQQRVKLSIQVWLDNGQRATITGVHGGHLKALGVDNASTVYPAHPYLSELLLERKKLRERVRQIDAILGKYEVRTSSGHGIRDYDEAVTSLQKRIAEASSKADTDLPGSSPRRDGVSAPNLPC